MSTLPGLVLGGSLCYHAALHQMNKIGKISVYNPAGLYSWNLDNVAFDRVATQITINANDLVSTMGPYRRELGSQHL